MAAKQVVEAETPVSPAADDGDTLAADSETPEPLWPAESALDEPSLEQEYHQTRVRHFQRTAERRYRRLLKARVQPRWKLTGVPPAEREHFRTVPFRPACHRDPCALYRAGGRRADIDASARSSLARLSPSVRRSREGSHRLPSGARYEVTTKERSTAVTPGDREDL